MIEDQLYVMSYHSIYSLEDDFNPLPVFKENGEEITPDAQDVSYIPGTPLESFTHHHPHRSFWRPRHES